MSDAPLSYRRAGVDVEGADRLVEALRPILRGTHTAAVVDHASRFAGLVRPDTSGMADPLIAATCDGVGTKVLLARSDDDFECLGRDLVAMNVNDLLPVGARPLLFLDYVAAGRLDAGVVESVVRGAAAACIEAGCAFVGGETAEMPGVYGDDGFDLAGFAVGVVDGTLLPDLDGIEPGYPVVGLPSTGIHANGLSLARAAILERAGLGLDDPLPGTDGTVAEILMTPTALYVRQVLDALRSARIKGAAHVTGGGLLSRAGSVVGAGLGVRIDPDTYRRPSVFDAIQACGDIDEAEMSGTFNMGLGFLAVTLPGDLADLVGSGWMHVGEVTSADGIVDLGYARR